MCRDIGDIRPTALKVARQIADQLRQQLSVGIDDADVAVTDEQHVMASANAIQTITTTSIH